MLKITTTPQEHTLYNAEDIYADLRQRVTAAGSQRALVEGIGVSAAYLSDVMRGKRGISEEFAAKLGYEPVTLWRKQEEQK